MSTATQQQPSTTFHTSPTMDPSTTQNQNNQANADAQRASSAHFPPQPAKEDGSQNTQPLQNQQQQQNQQNQQQQQQQQQQPISGPAASLMQLRAEIPPAPPPRGTRKRKSPPNAPDNSQAPPPPPQPQQPQPQQQPQPLPHPGPLGAPPPGVYPGLAYPYVPPPGDYTTAGMPPPHLQQPMPGAPPQLQQPQSPQGDQRPSRQLSTSKRAEQNRKAQRAFRERRDQHVRALESRSQLLDAALASADEANRRWEECRALVDQLRIENTALRTALQQSQQALAAAGVNVGAVGKKAGEAEADQVKQQSQAGPTATDTKEGS